MKVDELAFAFDCEIEAANTKCPNCGKFGCTVYSTDSLDTSALPSVSLLALLRCVRCDYAFTTPMTFQNAKFVL